jgi:hypothetical protein
MPVIAFPATRDAKGEDLEIESIAIGPRLRRLQPELVADLARSMAQIGQLSPIIVGGDGLIAALHRLEAAKKLGWRTIRSVYTEDHSAGLLRLMEIDENLMRADLCRQRSERRISTNGNRSTRLNFQRPDWMPAGRGRPKQVGQNEQPIARYTREAATKTGSSETTVKREVARGKSNPRYRVDCRDVA